MMQIPAILLYRPRLVNPLHAIGLLEAHSQTNPDELACLGRYAEGRHLALEIGTHMGVSAAVIAKVLDSEGQLFCADPWELRLGKENPCLTICRRELTRKGVLDRVVFLKGYSYEVESSMPQQLDFIFVDGDHSYEGLERDWGIVLRRLSKSGILCLHDTTIPATEPHRQHGAVDFFNNVIRHHPDFEWLECCYTLNVLRRRQVTTCSKV
jgi:predicted O-methyltransferase YrrM